ncbi:hypothetical protein KEU06_28850 [Pseudaminobacter sp. 19-2017]|uniref:Uncharacterized protein n=1 Tax=Pseudaminobacter soli (ex Zhang et al. 2022) TaxID=2831468 RepID=A0A942E2G5_9HYPH|nr:hypothetical protein [Pseudaminobacter soli]MBS3652589.1 hypothetical protein [Pseudaminobacter soli]
MAERYRFWADQPQGIASERRAILIIDHVERVCLATDIGCREEPIRIEMRVTDFGGELMQHSAGSAGLRGTHVMRARKPYMLADNPD